MALPLIHIIAGPTASGKSAIAQSLARAQDGVIINADSQQVYRDLRILSARPSEADEAELPHRLYGFVGADEHFSAGKWLRFAKMEIDWARTMGKPAIVVGGTGLYIKALMQGIAEMPAIDASVRAQAVSDYECMGKEAFAERLRTIDPAFFERLKVQDKQRLIRAYEVWLGTAKTLTFWQQQTVTAPYAPEEFVVQSINIPRAELYKRCDERFTQMLEMGALEEVKAIMPPDGSPIPFPLAGIIGVRELGDYIAGRSTLEAAISAAQQATRNYAKRQTTWFRNQLVA